MSFKKPDVKGLDISFEDINKSKEEEILTSRAFYKEIEKTYFEQKERETNFLLHYKWKCPPSVNETVLTKSLEHELKYVDIGKKRVQDSEEDYERQSVFLDSSSLEHLACVAKDIFLFDGPNFRMGYNFVKKIITDVRLIGTPSVSGYAMSANLYDKYKDMIVLKAPRRNEEYTETAINHELVVGKVLNSLRSIIPNFAFVLGAFKCGSPVIRPTKNEKGKIIDWCRGGAQVKYLMYENISNSISLYDYCDDCSLQEYIEILVQIMYALMIAYEEHGFTHYDLHGENILVRTIKESEDGFYLPYQGDFVWANKLATVIDYGNAHVYLGKDKISSGYKDETGPKGNLEFVSSQIYQDHPNAISDPYRVLITTLHYMKSRNKEVFEAAKILLYFFHPEGEDIDLIFKTKNGSRLPYFGISSYLEKSKKFRHRNFINYIREFCLANDLQDPVVSGKNYDEALDDAVIFPGLSFTSTELLRSKKSAEDSLIRKKIANIDELFDLLEPLVIYNEYLYNNSKSFGENKIGGHSSIVSKIFNKIKSQQNYIVSIVNEEIKDLKNKVKTIDHIVYKKIPRDEVYIIRSSTALKEYLDSVENTVKYLEDIESVEKKIEMIHYLKVNILRETLANDGDDTILDLDLVEKEFDRIDDRKVIFDFIYSDIVSLSNYLDGKKSLDSIDKKLDVVLDSLLSIYPEDLVSKR